MAIISMKIDDVHFYLDHSTPGFQTVVRFVEPDIGCLHYTDEQFWIFVECLTEYAACNMGHSSDYVNKLKAREDRMIEVTGEEEIDGAKIREKIHSNWEACTDILDLDKVIPNKVEVTNDIKPIVTELHLIYKELHELNKNLRRVK